MVWLMHIQEKTYAVKHKIQLVDKMGMRKRTPIS